MGRAAYSVAFGLCIVSVLSECTHSLNRAPKLSQVTQPVIHAEGPHWDVDKNVLFFVDISGQRLYRWEPTTDNVTFVDVGGDLGFAIPVRDSQDRFIGGRKRELVYIPWTGDDNVTLSVEQMEVIASVDNTPDKLGNRFNDGKADSTGRLWAGTIGAEPNGVVDPLKASLYSLETSSVVPLSQVAPVDVSNGIAWNKANDVMYYIDSPTRQVDAFDFSSETGVISNRRTIFSLDAFSLPGVPDGMTIDTEDHLWIALWGGDSVIKVDPIAQTLLAKIDLPVNQVTSVAFGGVGLSTLYVTTSRRGLSDEQLANQPLAGSVLALDDLGVVGTRAHSVVRNV